MTGWNRYTYDPDVGVRHVPSDGATSLVLAGAPSIFGAAGESASAANRAARPPDQPATP